MKNTFSWTNIDRKKFTWLAVSLGTAGRLELLLIWQVYTDDQLVDPGTEYGSDVRTNNRNPEIVVLDPGERQSRDINFIKNCLHTCSIRNCVRRTRYERYLF